MVQIAVPTGEYPGNTWLTQDLDSSIWISMDEGISNADDDSSYAAFLDPFFESPAGTYTGIVYLSGLVDPSINTSHILRVRSKRSDTLSDQSFNIYLYQGNTLIFNSGVTATSSYATTTFNLSETQASNITDYTDLSAWFDYAYDGATAGPRITALEFEVPDSGGVEGIAVTGILANRGNIRYGSHFTGVFIQTWNLSNDFGLTEITIPLNPSYSHRIWTNWNDLASPTINSNTSNDYSFLPPGDRPKSPATIGIINGLQYTNINPSYNSRVTDISSFGPLRIRNNYTFGGLTNLQITDSIGQPDFSFYNTPDYLFSGCTNLTANIGHWRFPSNLTSLKGWFYNCTNFTGSPGLSGWNTENITNMSELFYFCQNFNSNINNWNVSNVTDMSFMFGIADLFNQPIGSWQTSGVTNMAFMFIGASNFNQPIGAWNVGSVTDMNFMFYNATGFNQPLSGWNTSKVNNMSTMFYFATNFNQNIGSWQTSGVIDMSYMFYNATNFNNSGSPSISGWNTSNVSNMSNMFRGATNFNQPIGAWNVGSVTDMNSMFYDASAFNQSLSGWDTSNVTNMNNMFSVTVPGPKSVFNESVAGWNTSKVTDMSVMFRNSIFNHSSITGWDVSSVANMSQMFFFNAAFNQPIGVWNTANLTNISQMLRSTSSGFNQDLSNWKVTGIGVGGATNFMLSATGLSRANYDRTLSGWAQQSGNLKSGVSIHFGASKYSVATGQQYRNILIAKGWTITDGGTGV